MSLRSLPVILITGNPGVGKTTTATELASQTADSSTPLKHIHINELVKQKSLHEGYDDRLQTHIVDEDKLLDEVETIIDDGKPPGGWIIDYHVPSIFPERWADLVVILRCGDTKVYHDRLTARGYGEEKLEENVDAEIFGVIAEEAREAWPTEGAVVELESRTAEEIDENVERLLLWVKRWVDDRAREIADDEEE